MLIHIEEHSCTISFRAMTFLETFWKKNAEKEKERYLAIFSVRLIKSLVMVIIMTGRSEGINFSKVMEQVRDWLFTTMSYLNEITSWHAMRTSLWAVHLAVIANNYFTIQCGGVIYILVYQYKSQKIHFFFSLFEYHFMYKALLSVRKKTGTVCPTFTFEQYFRSLCMYCNGIAVCGKPQSNQEMKALEFGAGMLLCMLMVCMRVSSVQYSRQNSIC